MEKVEITREERDLILRGIRPEGMDYDVFRKVRKNMQSFLKMYKKGRHVNTSGK